MTSALGNVASLAARAGGAVARQVRSAIEQWNGAAGATDAPASGWLVVSIYCEPTEIDATALPAPLAEYGDRIETRIRPAAGGKGTELAVRLTRRSSGNGSAPARLSGQRPAGRPAVRAAEGQATDRSGRGAPGGPRPARQADGEPRRGAGGGHEAGRQGGCAVKAVTWRGVNEVGVEDVPEPKILNDHDIILEVGLWRPAARTCTWWAATSPRCARATCSATSSWARWPRSGRTSRSTRWATGWWWCSFSSCGQCWYCKQELWSLCDNGNPNPAITETLWGQSIGGCYGYSHAMGGWAGSHAPYMRVPYADQGAFAIPDGVSDERALFASDAAPTGWTGAHQAEVKPGDVVAVWGAGGVGQMAARKAMLMGAERVVVIDRLDNRLEQVRTHIGAETLDYEEVDVAAELREMSGGRGPDVCIEAVGMEAHSKGPQYLYDQVKQQLRLQSDRPTALREAIYACRKGGSVFALGVFAGLVDKFPLGAVMNKALTLRGAQQHGHRYIPEILDLMSRDEVKTEHLATHVMPLDDGPKGYRMFKNKEDGCVRAVFRPGR